MWAYFGCFLNVYDPGNVVNGAAVQALLAGTHHCLVAEIAYDGAPIVNANGIVATPESSDKLAQRNLQLTLSDNPGGADTHRVPQTFDLKPGVAIVPVAGELLDYPDELMIDWGRTPAGSVAHIFWPQINAIEVLQLANRLYATHLLSASDANTIDCSVGRGVTYIPIPPGTTENIAGLLTIDLPTTVVTGQEFDVIVRRVATRRTQVITRDVPRMADGDTSADDTDGPDAPRMAEHGGGTYHVDVAGGGGAADTDDGETNGDDADESAFVPAEVDEAEAAGPGERPDASHVKHGPVLRNWRYVTGTFQVKIPVTTPEVMLRPEQDTLAVMKWRFQQLAVTNRWRPVLERYISYLSARVAGLGGDPDAIPPSPDGAPTGDDAGGVSRGSYTGKVEELVYDCFGRFEGFVLAGCCDRRPFRTTECGFEDVLLKACRACLLVTVYFEHGKEDCIERLVIRC